VRGVIGHRRIETNLLPTRKVHRSQPWRDTGRGRARRETDEARPWGPLHLPTRAGVAMGDASGDLTAGELREPIGRLEMEQGQLQIGMN
jgi:hypothetical protein